MNKLILTLAMVITLVGCSINSATAPETKKCEKKKIGYDEVTTTHTEYWEQWEKAACVHVRYNPYYECTIYDWDDLIEIEECEE